MQNNKLFHLENLKRGKVIKRPSLHCKSPYVADVLLDNGDTILAHAPALGCNGYCDKDGIVYLSLLDKKGVCSHKIELAETDDNIIIGINPKLAERIVEEAIMKTDSVKTYKREKTILNSRFDFVGMNSDTKTHFVLEVKTVPLCIKPGTAYFPHGYRKKKGDAVSPRAVKHLGDLSEIAMHSDADAIMCYVIQRKDADNFIPSDSDPIYKKAFYDAMSCGVIMRTLFVEWDKYGNCFFKKNTIFS